MSTIKSKKPFSMNSNLTIQICAVSLTTVLDRHLLKQSHKKRGEKDHYLTIHLNIEGNGHG